MYICTYHNINQLQFNHISSCLVNPTLVDIANIIRWFVSDDFSVFIVPNENNNTKVHIFLFTNLKCFNPKFIQRPNWINVAFFNIQNYKNIYFLDPKFNNVWFYDLKFKF
jgi:hypothetical protein